MTREWKAGDEAILYGQIVTIDRVTPKGRLVVGNQVFNPDGSKRGGCKDPWVSARGRLRPATPESIATARQKAADLATCAEYSDAAARLSRHIQLITRPDILDDTDRATIKDLIERFNAITGHAEDKT